MFFYFYSFRAMLRSKLKLYQNYLNFTSFKSPFNDRILEWAHFLNLASNLATYLK